MSVVGRACNNKKNTHTIFQKITIVGEVWVLELYLVLLYWVPTARNPSLKDELFRIAFLGFVSDREILTHQLRARRHEHVHLELDPGLLRLLRQVGASTVPSSYHGGSERSVNMTSIKEKIFRSNEIFFCMYVKDLFTITGRRRPQHQGSFFLHVNDLFTIN